MIKNNKGISIVEIIVSVTLISIVLILLISVFITVRNEDERNQVSSNLLMNQLIITREIESDFIDLGLIEIASCKDGGAGSDTVLSVLPASSSITKEAKGHCLKLVYNSSKTKDNVGYLLQYSYGFSTTEPISVVGYVRGDKKVLREIPVLSDENGLVKNECGNNACALSITMPAISEEEDYGINLSYIFNKDMGFKFTNLELPNNYRFDISNNYIYVPPEPSTILKDAILAQGGGVSTIEAKGTPSFNVINGTNGLYATPDEYGMSYYYRGTKELNNNIIWGGFQWKIVRINGDGSVRLVYNGTCPNDTCSINSTGTNTQIEGTHAWNTSNYNDAKYVGYMYGGANGSASSQRFGTTSVSATYNQTNTNMKTILDNWYNTNIFNKGLGSQVADNLFCNDRQLRSDPGVGGASTGPGYGAGTSETHYAGYHRLDTNKTPTLKCGLQNDQFTTIMNGGVGNGALTYPVGLLTTDEASMAGLVFGSNNTTNYLYTNQHWWSFSPNTMDLSEYAHVSVINLYGALDISNVDATYGVRPSISIISATQVTGTGSAHDPFRVI